MASRLREDEKNEKIIRGLSKLPANRRCINCNSQGTQYVCTNFATFICINCSGIHREFTHRVKSISMAKFTPQEIAALQEGGNERAKRIYFKSWDFERQSLPDSSDIDKLRDFIKHIYVDQRFIGERNADKPPVLKVEREDSNQEKSLCPLSDRDPVNGTSNSNSDKYQEPVGPTSRSVVEVTVVVPPSRILEPPKKLDTPSTLRTPAPVTPVAPVAPVAPVEHVQSIETASNVKDTSTQNGPEVKLVSSINLIDFDSDPEPVPKQHTPPTANQNRDVGWASFDTQRPSFAAAAAPSSANNLETSLVHQPAPGPVPVGTYSKMPPQNNISLFPTMQRSNPQSIQSWGQPVAPNGHTTSIAPNHASFARGPQHFMNGQGALPVGVTPLQAPASPAVPNAGRNALPEDLFSMIYARPPAPMPGWHSAPRIPMGYTMQYPTPSPASLFAQPMQSTNPFDVASVPKLAHASTLPSMSSMQGALPNLNSGNPNPYYPNNALSRATSMGSFGAQSYQPSYPPASHPSQYSTHMYVNNMVQQIPNNTYYTGNQVLGGYGTVGGGYRLSGMNPQQLSVRNPQPGNAGSFPSVGRNPFS